VIDIVKKCIDEKIKNLHPEVEEMVINEVFELGLTAKHKIISYIRKRLELPKIGSDKKVYWEKRGWSEEEIERRRIKKKMPSSPMKYENWLDKINEKTGNFYTIDEAKYKVNSFRKTNKEYWIEKGYSEEDSIKKVKEHQKENSNKFVSKILENPEKYTDRTPTQIGYWLKKGYSEEDSNILLRERQDTQSIDFYTKKYGDLAKEKYKLNNTNKSYKASQQYYIDLYGIIEGKSKYIEIIKKRTVNATKSSKEAYYFLLPIYKFLRVNGIDKSDIFWGVGSSKEWFISIENNFFLYDFTIKSIKVIIEYHGIKFHPKEGQTDWKPIYGNISYIEKLNLDKIKENIAKEKGFKYFKVYSDEDLKNKQNEIIEYLINCI
jgi:hypothetical protein